MPSIDEGDLLYMPSTLPGISASQSAALLQTTDKLIKTVPEVDTVFGKVGKAETATDSAPMEMIETTIRLKPKSEWRPGMTIEKIIDELDATVRLPGLANLWIPPIRNRIDMLSTGVKSPIGIKVSGTSLRTSTKRRDRLKVWLNRCRALPQRWRKGWRAVAISTLISSDSRPPATA